MEVMQVAINASAIHRIEAVLPAGCRINLGSAAQNKHAVANGLKVVSSSHLQSSPDTPKEVGVLLEPEGNSRSSSLPADHRKLQRRVCCVNGLTGQSDHGSDPVGLHCQSPKEFDAADAVLPAAARSEHTGWVAATDHSRNVIVNEFKNVAIYNVILARLR